MPAWRQEFAVWVGRVQPFHLGHLAVLRRSLQIQDRPHINGIVSHNYDGLSEEPPGKHARGYNPFTPWERYVMVRTCLAALGLEARVTTVFVPYLPMSNWVATRDYLPERFVMCTSNKDADDVAKTRVWDSLGWPSIVVDVQDLEPISSSDLRHAAVAGRDWREFIHESVHEYFREIDGPGRLLRSAVEVLP